LQYAAEFVSPATEAGTDRSDRWALAAAVSIRAVRGQARVAWFGFEYDYALRRLQDADPIPEWLGPINKQVEAFGGPETRIGQVLCTEYDVGVGIGWHRDKPHFDTVFGLSLGSTCKFRFRRTAGEKWERFTLNAEPRSLYLMSGPSRHVWEHSIPAVAAPRYSITFRTMVERKILPHRPT
jgi:alkylated DNA repair dioxygenase AlkB